MEQEISFILVFFMGILSFLSPCVLPLIPVYVFYISGVGIKEIENPSKYKIFINTLLFILGFTFAFIILQILFFYFANFTSKYINNGIFYKFAGIFIVIFSLNNLGLLKFKFLMKEKKINLDFKNKNLFFSFLIGFIFGFGWSPCMGPILAMVMTYISNTKTISKGIFYLFGYSFGLGIPFIIFALFTDKIKAINIFFKKNMRKIEIISGIIMLIMGILLFFNRISIISDFKNIFS